MQVLSADLPAADAWLLAVKRGRRQAASGPKIILWPIPLIPAATCAVHTATSRPSVRRILVLVLRQNFPDLKLTVYVLGERTHYFTVTA